MTPRPELCVGAVVIDGDSMLLIQRGRGVGIGQWSIPGGRVELGESLPDAVRRELREEAGLTAGAVEHLGTVERRGDDWWYVIHDYLVDVIDVDARAAARAGDDAADVAWWPVADLAVHPQLSPGLLDFLAEVGLVVP